MQKILVIFSFLILGSSFNATAQKKVDWLTWEEAMEKSKLEKRKIVVDVYTEWCGWCKKMDKTTFQADKIVEYINKNYYAVKFDAERKKQISYNDKEYSFIKSGRNGYHELAAELLQGRLSFPTVVFLDEETALIQPIPGFQDAVTFEMIIKFFAEDHYKKTPWPKFTASYKPEVALPVRN